LITTFLNDLQENLLLILYWSLNFLCFDSKIIQIIIFIFNAYRKTLYAYSNLLYAHSKYYESNISMNPLFLWVNSRRGESSWLIPSLAYIQHHGDALKMFLYAHSKCIGSCSIHIQNMAGAALFYNVGA
jgi:hypothetical protein